MAVERRRLEPAVAALDAAALDAVRPGGWDLRRVLGHLIDAEHQYAALLSRLAGGAGATARRESAAPRDGAAAVTMLAEARTATLAAAEAVPEEDLYRMTAVGRDEYSPLSVLENVAAHDAEHLEQIAELAALSRGRRAPREDAAQVSVRAAVEEDLPRLTEIYNYYVTDTIVTFDLEPYSVEDRRRLWFVNYAPRGRHRLLVAERDGVIGGYTSSSRYHARRAYETTVECTILCAPEHLGFGLGQRLYEALFQAGGRGGPRGGGRDQPPERALLRAARADGLRARRHAARGRT